MQQNVEECSVMVAYDSKPLIEDGRLHCWRFGCSSKYTLQVAQDRTVCCHGSTRVLDTLTKNKLDRVNC